MTGPNLGRISIVARHTWRSVPRACCAAALLTTIAPTARTQSGPGDRSRPPLRAGLDANSPQLYFELGLQMLRRAPQAADSSFVWAARLDPMWEQPYYGEAMARLGALGRSGLDPKQSEDRAVVAGEMEGIDSLVHEAFARNPFLDPVVDAELSRSVPGSMSIEMPADSTGRVPGRRRIIAPPSVQAQLAFVHGDRARAREIWAAMMRTNPKMLLLHIARARAFFLDRMYDSTVSELQIVVDSLNARQERSAKAGYYSKEMLYYAMAIARVQQNELQEARQLLGRALQENLAFYMAHVRLGGVDVLEADTAAAVNELRTAVEIHPGDAGLRFQLGYLLMLSGQASDAESEYRAAISADPDFAQPYYHLALALDRRGALADARDSYQDFLDHAMRDDALLPSVVRRVLELDRALASRAARQ